MYSSYYNLSKKPFEITTDPEFLWLGEQHQEALATLEYGIREDKGFLLLTGDVGTGKTVLINGLVKTIGIRSVVSAVPDPGLDPLDFFNYLAESFRINRRVHSKGEFLAYLKKFLIKAEAVRRKVLLVIDESQRLNHQLLEEVRLLSNIELDNRRLINIFFVGQPEFNDILMEPRNKAVRQRIGVRYHIKALSEKETEKYVLHRLRVAGTNRKIYTAAALREVYAFSAGNPRLTNIICDRALLTGYSAEMKVIDSDVIRECAEELRLPDEVRVTTRALAPASAPAVKTSAAPEKRSFSIVTMILAALIAGGIIVAGHFLISREPEITAPWSPDEIAPSKPPAKLPDRSELNIEETAEPQTPAPAQPSAPVPARPVEIAPPLNPELLSTGSLKPPEPPEENPSAQQPAATDPEGSIQIQSTGKTASGADLIEKETPKTPESPEIDLTQVGKVVIRFKRNSNELSRETYQNLDRFADALIKSSDTDVLIKGHTDSSGALSYNMSVSEFRANIIKTYFIGKGVSPERITSVGMGPEEPVATNDTLEGRNLNRRVEIEFTRRPEQ